MSLLVNAYQRDNYGKIQILDPIDPSDELAGFESFRTTLYGGQVARSVGLRLLPMLGHQDLYVELGDLPRLRAEIELVMENLEQCSKETGVEVKVIQDRLQNVLKAVRRAEELQGGVVIW
jgi:hypothetical protein